jgi:hypothetical protein
MGCSFDSFFLAKEALFLAFAFDNNFATVYLETLSADIQGRVLTRNVESTVADSLSSIAMV